MIITRDNFSYDKLYLTRDSEYGTHVLYFNHYINWNNGNVKYYDILINEWVDEENFFKLIDYIIQEINIQIIKIDKEK